MYRATGDLPQIKGSRAGPAGATLNWTATIIASNAASPRVANTAASIGKFPADPNRETRECSLRLPEFSVVFMWLPV